MGFENISTSSLRLGCAINTTTFLVPQDLGLREGTDRNRNGGGLLRGGIAIETLSHRRGGPDVVGLM